MRKYRFRILIPIIFSLTLSGCTTLNDLFNSGTLNDLPTDDFNIGSLNNNIYSFPITLNPDTTDNFFRPQQHEYKNDALKRNISLNALPSTGTQNILVIPVVFADFPNYGGEDVVSNLERTFFGAAEDTGWESVSSYYYKSSYGKLTINGSVSEPFKLNMTTTQLEEFPVDDYLYWDQTHYLIEQIYHTADAIKLKQYDQDNDGYVDALWLVYLAPIDRNSDLYWAYQYHWNQYPDLAKPTFNTYAWASYDFIAKGNEYSYTKPSAHTYIHETGHLLGLDDYYDYDVSELTGTPLKNPAGAVDMMDSNILDHNMYSKFLLNWAQPFVPVGNSDIELRPFANSGDFILINNKWNGHAYDEYILIEYYTPTGLNAKDSLILYGNEFSSGFSVPGVRIWHVDSRLIYHENSKLYWTDQIKSSTTSYSKIGPSNTTSKSVKQQYKLLHLLDANKSNRTWYHGYRKAGNSALFDVGDKIGVDQWQEYLFLADTFNDGLEIGYSIEVTGLNANGASIKLRTSS